MSSLIRKIHELHVNLDANSATDDQLVAKLNSTSTMRIGNQFECEYRNCHYWLYLYVTVQFVTEDRA